jgi:hypothetical protein
MVSSFPAFGFPSGFEIVQVSDLTSNDGADAAAEGTPSLEDAEVLLRGMA